MEESFVVFANLPDFLQRLSDSDFVIHVDHTAEKRIWSHCFLQLLQINEACRKLDWQISDLETQILKPSARVKDAFVIYLSGYDVLLLVTVKLSHSFQRHVIALSGSAGENDFFALSSDHLCNVGSGLLAGNLSIPSVLVRFGVRISEVISQVRKHGIKDSWVHWSRCLIIKIQRRVIVWVIHLAVRHLHAQLYSTILLDIIEISTYFDQIWCGLTNLLRNTFEWV